MLKTLSEKGLLDYEKYDFLALTETGSDVGQEIDHKHQILKSFLTNILKIDYNQADADACKMEHAVSPATLVAFADFTEFIESCPRGGASWLGYFNPDCAVDIYCGLKILVATLVSRFCFSTYL